MGCISDRDRPTGRLTAVAKDGMTISTYSYDANNNRIAATVNDQNVSATYDTQDRMLSYGTKTYTYTPNGEVASVYDSSNQKSWTYDYDVFGELKDATNSAGLKITYLYDGEHHRVAKEINGVIERKFVYNEGGQLIGEYNASGGFSEFVYASQSYSPDFMLRGSNKYYFVKDHLGSIRLVVDYSTGQVMERLDYDEFGNVLQDTNPGFQPFGFAGGLYNSKTGLVHFGARDYDPSTGRWGRKDPLLFDGGEANLYSYAFNDPVNYIDPSGTDSSWLHQIGDYLRSLPKNFDEKVHTIVKNFKGNLSDAINGIKNFKVPEKEHKQCNGD